MNQASDRAQQLIALTQRLTARLAAETAAFEARRPQDAVPGMQETQDLANIYRRESARVKADPRLLSEASPAERSALISATQAFEAVLDRHGRVVEAARIISEGLVQAIAQEVAAGRAQGIGYGASGHAAAGDTRAVTLNRMA